MGSLKFVRGSLAVRRFDHSSHEHKDLTNHDV